MTDILHPVTVGAFVSTVTNVEIAYPRFIGATSVSYIDGPLVRLELATPDREVISNCAQLFGWSPDGTTAAFVSNPLWSTTADLHLVTAGQNRVIDSIPSGPIASDPNFNQFDAQLLYAPNGAYLSLLQVPEITEFRIWRSDGTRIASIDTSQHPTMSVWSGDTLHWRDDKGVERWRGGVQSLWLGGVKWIRPKASPRGGQIVYETRDSGDIPYVSVLDTATGAVRQLAGWRSAPVFLSSNLIWYQEERPCTASDSGVPGFGICVYRPNTPSGKTFIYDLQTGTETESDITAVYDVWPHPA